MGSEVPMDDLSVSAILRAEVRRTEEVYAQSKRHFQKICGEVPSGLPHPDGRQRIELAARAQTDATLAYTQALHRFNEFLLNGRVPDDLRSKSSVIQQPISFSQEQRQVAKCAFCGSETRMFENDHPICAGCASRLDAGEKLIPKQPASEKSSTEENKKSTDS
jgi:hypothetical protein